MSGGIPLLFVSAFMVWTETLTFLPVRIKQTFSLDESGEYVNHIRPSVFDNSAYKGHLQISLGSQDTDSCSRAVSLFRFVHVDSPSWFSGYR